MSETCQKLVFTHPIVVLKSGLKDNWMKKFYRVSQPLDLNFSIFRHQHLLEKTLQLKRLFSYMPSSQL